MAASHDVEGTLRATLAALQVNEERLRLAIESGEVGIWDWDIVGNDVTWSDRVYEMHRMVPGSDIGGLDGFRSRVHPDDLARVESALAQALQGGPPYAVEFRHCWRDGEIRWIATRGHLLRDAEGRPLRMVGASIDITERMRLLAAEREARAEAEASRRRLEILAAAGEQLSGSLDPDHTLEAIAHAIVPGIADWCRIDLIDEEGVLRRRLAHHSDPATARHALEMARVMYAATNTVGSMAWCVANGSSYHGRFDEPPATDDPVLREYTAAFGMGAHFILPLVVRGRTIGAMGVVQAESGRALDEADRALIHELGRRAALALDNARAYAEAESARRAAESANRAKDEFLAMLGHELRNPLAPIVTVLELMERRDGDLHLEERRVIGRQVTHLSRMIDDLLDVSRIAQGKVELQREMVDLRAVLANALEQTQPLYERRAGAVVVSMDDAPANVVGDATRLTQVVCNLLINAAKFTPREGRVELAMRSREGWTELVVQDNGRGIAPALLPRVFDLFVQGEQALDRGGGGLGLGLAIVRTLVERHGGTVHAESDGEGLGSRFIVRMPAALAAKGDSVTDQEPGPEPVSTGGARVLLVDDNADAAETLGELLRIVGYEVHTAGDGVAALKAVESFVPDVGLLDIGLPGMDGYELAEKLRADPRLAALKLVALTGYGRDNDRARAKAARFDEHLVKPVGAEQLFDVLERLLAK